MTRAALYARISNDPEGREAGVERQEFDGRALADRLGWDVADTYVDNDISAASGKRRPEWERMLDDLAAGRIDAIVAYSSSRMYRRPRDLQRLLDIVKARGTLIETVASGRIDLHTADGRMIAGILADVDMAEAERAGERQAARWAQRRRDGKETRLGRVAFGFDRVGTPGDRRNVVNEAQAAVIRDAAARIIGGESLYRLAMSWRDTGVRTPSGNAWRPQHLRRMLMGDILVEHGILSADEHTAVTAALAVEKPLPARVKPSGRKYALGGIIRCGLCNARLEGSSGAYHCGPNNDGGCGRIGVKATAVERYVCAQVFNRSEDDATSFDATVEVPVVDTAPILAAMADLDARIDALAENTTLSDRVLAVRVKAFEAKRDALAAELVAANRADAVEVPWFVAKVDPDVIARWNDRKLTEAETAAMREFVSAYVDAIHVDPGLAKGKRMDPDRIRITWRATGTAAA